MEAIATLLASRGQLQHLTMSDDIIRHIKYNISSIWYIYTYITMDWAINHEVKSRQSDGPMGRSLDCHRKKSA
jgi:hypothetical protein